MESEAADLAAMSRPSYRKRRVPWFLFRHSVVFVAYVATLVITLIVGSSLAGAAGVIWPREADPTIHDANVTNLQADAVVVLAGGRGERAERALELMTDGAAPVLVANVGNRDWGPGWEMLEPICRVPATGYEVRCVTVSPDNTAGEAATIAALAEANGWDSLILVTSDYHLHRATVRFEACFDGEVLPVAAEVGLNRNVFLYEWLGTMEARHLDRGCSGRSEQR